MLIGLQPKKNAAAPSGAENNAVIFDVTTAEFEQKILKESEKRPVLIDFWAPWCGPCKQLTPVLEDSVRAQKGKVALAKVNIDTNPELAQAFRVQSIPMVVAIFKGQPVTGFAGVRPKAELDKIIQQLAGLQAQGDPAALDIATALQEAAQFLSEQRLAEAQSIYAAILATEPEQTQALSGMIRVFIAAGQVDQAAAIYNQIPEALSKDPALISAKAAIDIAQSAPKDDPKNLLLRLQQNPDDADTRFKLAEIYAGRGLKDQAAEELLFLIKYHRTWEEDKARHQLLKYFEAWGGQDPATMKARKRLSTLLFS